MKTASPKEVINIMINHEQTIKEKWNNYRGKKTYGDFVDDYIKRRIKNKI